MPRTGRPKVENPNEKNLTIRINAVLDEKLTNYCKKNSVTKGDVVRRGIEKVLSESKKEK